VVVFINSWGLVIMNMTGKTKQARGLPKIDTLDTLLTILIIIGIILAVKTIQATTPYTTQYLNNLACTYKAFLTGDLKTYTACTTNALKTMWNALEATPKILTQGWW
jgi:hypothetical protein